MAGAFRSRPRRGPRAGSRGRAHPAPQPAAVRLAQLCSSVLTRATQAWLVFFYAPPKDEDLPTIVPRLTLATILFVMGVFDALDEPLAGYWSDRTRSRWGRRVPFVLFATPFYALFFFLFWTPPRGSYVLAAVYLTIILLLTAALPFFADVVILRERATFDVTAFGRAFELQEGAVSSLLFGATIIAAIAALPLVYRLAVGRGKAWVYSQAMFMGALTFPLLFFMGFVPGFDRLAQSVVFLVAVGLPMVGVFTFPNAIIADIIDYDALYTGARREALHYGVQHVIDKWTSSLAFPLFAGLLLVGETAADPLGIRLIGPVAGVAALAAWAVFRGYRLPDSVNPETVPPDRRGWRSRPAGST